MNKSTHLIYATLVGLGIMIAGCGPATTATHDSRAAAPPPKNATFGMGGIVVSTLVTGYQAERGIRGQTVLTGMLASSLTTADDQGVLIPMLAEQAPSLENGLWKTFPDGSMEVTYHIRSGATWHDGTSVTAADFLLASRIIRDRNLPVAPQPWTSSAESFAAPNPQTLVVKWSSPYIYADAIFGLPPLPDHVLTAVYAADPATVLDNPYWTSAFIGTGPFKLESYQPNTQIVLTAYDHYFLGRPLLDRVTVLMIPDNSTMAANLLAGTVELTMDQTLTLDQALAIRDAFQGAINLREEGVIWMFPQLLDPTPAIVSNVQFRKALYHAIDRPTLVQTMDAGLTKVLDAFVGADDPDYQGTLGGVVKYDYDPRKTAQMLQDLGLRRGPDGYVDSSGQQLPNLEIRTTATDDLQMAISLVTASNFESQGIKSSVFPASEQLKSDLAWRSTYPAFEVARQGNDILYMTAFITRNIPTAANNWVGKNRIRDANPEFDALVASYLTTLSRTDRLKVATQMVHHWQDNVLGYQIFSGGYPILVGKTLKNVNWRTAGDSYTTHLWDKAAS